MEWLLIKPYKGDLGELIGNLGVNELNLGALKEGIPDCLIELSIDSQYAWVVAIPILILGSEGPFQFSPLTFFEVRLLKDMEIFLKNIRSTSGISCLCWFLE